MSSKLFPTVEIIWQDSEQNAEWSSLESVLEDQGKLDCKTVGYLVADREDRVILASTMSDDDAYEEHISHYMTIPKLCITSMTQLSPKKTKKVKIDPATP